MTAYSEPTSIYEDEEDEDEGGSRGTWAVALAAVLLLVIVAGGVLTSLGALGSNQAAAPHTPKASASETASAGLPLGRPDRQGLERTREDCIRGAFRSLGTHVHERHGLLDSEPDRRQRQHRLD